MAQLSPKEIKYRLEHYFKVAIVRHPMQRLVSGYRNKIESTVDTTQIRKFPETLKIKILKKMRQIPKQSRWEEYADFVANMTVTFDEFVNYLLSIKLSEYNEHFTPVLKLCHPCAVKYDFYPNFKVLDYDLYALMSLFSIPHEYYPHKTSRYPSVSDVTETYFHEKLSKKQKDELFEKFKYELGFYSTLYPEDKGYHESLY